MKIFEFGCAPEAVKEGYTSSIKLFTGTLEQVKKVYDGRDVAVIYGAKIFGANNEYEFGVMCRTA